MQTLKLPLALSILLLPLPVLAQDNAAPAATAPAPEVKKRGGGPSLGLSPDTPQAGGRLTSPAEPAPVIAAEPSAEWKFDVTGYFRAPMRFSWGPATTMDARAGA